MYLHHGGGLSNSPKFSLSTWFKVIDPIPSDSGASGGTGQVFGHDNYDGIPLFEWGYQNAYEPAAGWGPNAGWSFIWLRPDGRVIVNLMGPKLSLVNGIIDFNTGQTEPFPPVTAAPFELAQASFMPGARMFGSVAAALSGWNHLFISADYSSPDQWTHKADDPQFSNVPAVTAQVAPIAIVLNNSVDVPGIWGNIVDPGGGFGVTFTPLQLGNATYAYNAFGDYWQPIGGILLGDSPMQSIFFGFDFGHPGMAQNIDGGPIPDGSGFNWTDGWVDYAPCRVAFAYTQIWIGTYIAPTPTNLAKFYTVKGSVIVPPTNIKAAQAAFGASDVFWYRDKSKKVQYQTNNGTAGVFTAVGTLIDYYPGPGQAPALALEEPIMAPLLGGQRVVKPEHLLALPEHIRINAQNRRLGQDQWRQPSRRPRKPGEVIRIGNSRLR